MRFFCIRALAPRPRASTRHRRQHHLQQSAVQCCVSRAYAGGRVAARSSAAMVFPTLNVDRKLGRWPDTVAPPAFSPNLIRFTPPVCAARESLAAPRSPLRPAVSARSRTTTSPPPHPNSSCPSQWRATPGPPSRAARRRCSARGPRFATINFSIRRCTHAPSRPNAPGPRCRAGCRQPANRHCFRLAMMSANCWSVTALFQEST